MARAWTGVSWRVAGSRVQKLRVLVVRLLAPTRTTLRPPRGTSWRRSTLPIWPSGRNCRRWPVRSNTAMPPLLGSLLSAMTALEAGSVGLAQMALSSATSPPSKVPPVGKASVSTVADGDRPETPPDVEVVVVVDGEGEAEAVVAVVLEAEVAVWSIVVLVVVESVVLDCVVLDGSFQLRISWGGLEGASREWKVVELEERWVMARP